MTKTVNALVADLQVDFAAIMDDDSMNGAHIQAGDVVYFVACDHVDNGQIAAVQTAETVEIRRVWQHSKYIELSPANMAYAAKIFAGDDRNRVKIRGKAVSVLHTFED